MLASLMVFLDKVSKIEEFLRKPFSLGELFLVMCVFDNPTRLGILFAVVVGD